MLIRSNMGRCRSSSAVLCVRCLTTESIPTSTLPNTTCLPSKCGIGRTVMKKCDAGALVASILIGVMQTFAVGLDWSFVGGLKSLGFTVTPETFGYPLWKLKLSQTAPILPYLLLVVMLVVRPKGLLGTRDE